MKKNRIFSNLLAALAVITALASVYLISIAMAAPPIMVGQPAAISARVEEMLTAVCRADYETVSGMLYERPNLGSYPEERSAAEDLLWTAYLESLEYEIMGNCYAGDSGLTVDVKIRALDINETVSDLGNRTQRMLADRMEQAENISEIYNESNDFHQEMVMEILREATMQSLQESTAYQEQTISLNLVFEKGEWWILPNTELLNILSGAVSD